MQKIPQTSPWKRKRKLTGKPKKKMTPEQIAMARKRAEDAGRPYPNLIDNMWALKQLKR